jgi:hypothetical protein
MKKKIGRFLIVLLALIMSLSVVTVAKEVKPFDSTQNAKLFSIVPPTEETAPAADAVPVETAAAEAEETAAPEEQPAEPLTAAERSPLDDLMDFKLTIDGAAYKMPFPVNELLANGWAFRSKDEETRMYQYGHPRDIDLVKGNYSLYVRLANPVRDTQQAATDCLVTQLRYSVPDGGVLNIGLPGGISPESKITDVVGVYGEPHAADSDTYGGGGNYYGYPDEDYIAFHGGGNDGMSITLIELRCTTYFNNPANADGQDIEVPVWMPDYTPPSEVGEKLANGVFAVDGKPIRIQAPLYEFLNDGWKLFSAKGSDMLISAGERRELVIYKGGKILLVNLLHRHDGKEIPIELALVSAISDQQRNGRFSFGGSLELAGGIKVGSSLADTLAAFAVLEPNIEMKGQDATFNIWLPDLQYKVIVADGIVTSIYIED